MLKCSTTSNSSRSSAPAGAELGTPLGPRSPFNDMQVKGQGHTQAITSPRHN